jgi:hypothetical protein
MNMKVGGAYVIIVGPHEYPVEMIDEEPAYAKFTLLASGNEIVVRKDMIHAWITIDKEEFIARVEGRRLIH